MNAFCLKLHFYRSWNKFDYRHSENEQATQKAKMNSHPPFFKSHQTIQNNVRIFWRFVLFKQTNIQMYVIQLQRWWRKSESRKGKQLVLWRNGTKMSIGRLVFHFHHHHFSWIICMFVWKKPNRQKFERYPAFSDWTSCSFFTFFVVVDLVCFFNYAFFFFYWHSRPQWLCNKAKVCDVHSGRLSLFLCEIFLNTLIIV